MKNKHAAALGQLGGKVKSEAKAKAAAKNWKKALKAIAEARKIRKDLLDTRTAS